MGASRLFTTFISSAVVCALALVPGLARADDAPAPVRILNKDVLVLNGVGTYRLFFFRIYDLSLYLNAVTKDPNRILNSPTVKVARMRFRRSLSAKRVKGAFVDAYRENCGHTCRELEPHLQKFLAVVPDINEDQHILFEFHADKTVIVLEGIGEVKIDSAEFGRVILKTWLGDRAPSSALRDGVLGIK